MSTSNIVNSLGAGSGIDIKSLAESLVDVERSPRKSIIEARIGRSEARISGYAAIKFSLSELKAAFSKLNDSNDFSSLKTSNTQPTAFNVRNSPTATTGSYSLSVEQLAAGQRSASAGFASTTEALTSGASPFSLKLLVGSAMDDPEAVPTTINVTNNTSAGIVSAINGAKLGLSAQIINTGDATHPFTIVVSGPEGQAQRFSLSSADGVDGLGEPVPGVSFSRRLQQALDAEVEINGLLITRPTNTISQVIEGVSFDLYATTTAPARVDLTRESTGIKQGLESLVTAYNDFQEALKILGDRQSEVEGFGGALAGDSLLSSMRDQIRSLVTATSSTPGSTIRAARDVGLSMDRNGKLTLDSTQLDKALASNFDEVVTMFSANTNNQSTFSNSPGGLAGDAIKTLDRMLRSTGQIELQNKGAAAQIERYKSQLSALESRMEKLLERYTRQFTAMESIVGNSNSTRDNLKGSFDGMMNAYRQ
jgi:flagellar hook-associated protein 2